MSVLPFWKQALNSLLLLIFCGPRWSPSLCIWHSLPLQQVVSFSCLLYFPFDLLLHDQLWICILRWISHLENRNMFNDEIAAFLMKSGQSSHVFIIILYSNSEVGQSLSGDCSCEKARQIFLQTWKWLDGVWMVICRTIWNCGWGIQWGL